MQMQEEAWLQALQRFLSGRLYLTALTAVVIISQVFGLDMLGITALCLTVVFVCWFGKDTTPAIPAVCLILFCVSLKNSPWAMASAPVFGEWWLTTGEPAPLFTSNAFWIFVLIFGSMIVLSAIFRMVLFGNMRKVYKRNTVFVGIVCLSVSFLLGGIFSASWQIDDLWSGFLQAATFFFIYLFFAATLDEKQCTLDYIADVMLCGLCCMLTAIVCAYSRSIPMIKSQPILQQKLFLALEALTVAGWGGSNAIGLYISLTLCACFYKMSKAEQKHKWVWSVILFVALIATVLSLCRTAILVSGVIFIAGSVCLLCDKDNRSHILFTILAYMVPLIFIIAYKYDYILTNFIQPWTQGDLNQIFTGRIDIWKRYVEYFKQNPIFGAGFLADKEAWVSNEFVDAEGGLNMFAVSAHNILLQALGGSGIVGLLCLTLHLASVIWLVCKHRSMPQIFFSLALGAFLIMCMVDTVFYATQFTFLYLFIVLGLQCNVRRLDSEKREAELAKKDKDETYKPRVVFPYVEAGLGHIMPMRSLADAFEKKYGDRCQVIRSHFFTESNSWSLQRFEHVLKRGATSYAKTSSTSRLHMLLMHVFAPWIAPRAIMDWYVIGAGRAARKHLQTLDADMVVSTHWATSYYAENTLPKPINVSYVPDAQIVELCRYPSDAVLISKRPGYERALKKHKHRFHENNLFFVPFAIRGEALKIEQDKRALRKRFGLDEEKITVILMEGGYGYGKLEELAACFIQEDLPINLIVVCGKNQEAYERLRALPIGANTKIRIDAMCEPLTYLAASDVLVGKGGASTLAEATYFGLAMLVNRFSTVVEKNNAEYYIHHVQNALGITQTPMVLDKIKAWCEDNTELLQMQENARREKQNYGSEKTADLLYQLLAKRYPSLKE